MDDFTETDSARKSSEEDPHVENVFMAETQKKTTTTNLKYDKAKM